MICQSMININFVSKYLVGLYYLGVEIKKI